MSQQLMISGFQRVLRCFMAFGTERLQYFNRVKDNQVIVTVVLDLYSKSFKELWGLSL